MQKIWTYEDYVSRLSHPEATVRQWAMRAIEKRYPGRYTDEVAQLIGDENSHLACAAPRYLAKHGAVQHAEKILNCFRNSEGNVRDNCASALGRLNYVPASSEMMDIFLSPERIEAFFGLTDYFANVDLEGCRDVLRSALEQLTDPFELEVVAISLLHHFKPQDAELIIDTCLHLLLEGKHTGRLESKVATILSGEGFYRDLTESETDLLEEPKACLGQFIEHNFIAPPTELVAGVAKVLHEGRFREFSEMVMFAARTSIQERYGDGEVPDWLQETYNKDQTSLAVLETLVKRSSIWKTLKDTNQSDEPLLALILSLYFGIFERKNHLGALNPEADLNDLLDAMVQSCSDFPKALQDRIVADQPGQELIDLLSVDLSTWGDIWVVKTMGRIGTPAFLPRLLRVLNETDGLSYIHDEALSAIKGIADDEGDKLILDTVKNGEVGDSISTMSLLRHLSYSESYDIALEKWHDDSNDIDDYETFAVCLEGIGDQRGVKILQDIYKYETTHMGVAEPLECLARLYDMNIPELDDIAIQRIENEKFSEQRAVELANLARYWEKNKNRGPSLPAKILPFKRENPKVGRNDPCPCGSGKKYKKCCLRK